MRNEADYYAVLQLPPGCSVEQVRDNYRRLVKVFHPDRNGGDPWCQEQLKRINIAFEFLSDPDKKAAYDARAFSVYAVPQPPVRSVVPPLSPSSSQRSYRKSVRVAVYGVAESSYYSPPIPRRRQGLRPASAAALGCAALIAVFGVGFADMHRGAVRPLGHIARLRSMTMIPTLNTGLMSQLTGAGPRQAQRAYFNQLDAVTDDAQSELGDAHDTLTDLRFQDQDDAGGSRSFSRHHDISVQNMPASADAAAMAAQRHLMEMKLIAQSSDLARRLRTTSADMNRFDWTTPGVRKRLRTSSIDEELQRVDDGIDPLRETIYDAQKLLLERSDPFQPKVAPVSATNSSPIPSTSSSQQDDPLGEHA